ncbi:MAG: hydroxyacylglutathione hydrolase [Nocardioidaceae bacterium]|jgi:glyoxylase-like metal-dependent hydrolase (beta-lactamase superfamily II)/rhodanese-related sulfurtransferase|nr:hydroxyacylglutathione hydrolase [Nocardioidaceae bacterium]
MDPDHGRTKRLRGITVAAVETPSLGDRSYVVHDGEVAFVVDPQRDVDRLGPLLDDAGAQVTHVLETHLHNDYLTGGLALARRTGADYLVNADDAVAFPRTPVHDGQTFAVGRMRITALATPGHTFTHLAYALATDDGEPLALFSGGSLLYGSTGRPDLLGPEHTDVLARHQHASARSLAALLPDAVELFPTHGFGSFCSSTQSDATESTIGDEKATNPALTQSEEQYVAELLAGLGAYPTYYSRMARLNAAGPAEPELQPPSRADAAELRRRLEAGEWVVDLRHRTAFAAGHAPGTLNVGLDGAFATYLGWLMPWGTPVTLLGDSGASVEEAQRELVRIGIDRPAAQSTGGPENWSDDGLASFPTATFADLRRELNERPVPLVDVRRQEEHTIAHIEGALNIPVHELPDRIDELTTSEVWVHCASGYRASIAASLLDASGRRPVAINDEFDNAAAAGLPLVRRDA